MNTKPIKISIMKTTYPAPLRGLLCGLALATASTAFGQSSPIFRSGSDGSDGALDVTTDTTLQLPEDGIFNFTTINVANSATLTFGKNPANTPVYLLATGDVTIDGTISVDGTAATGAAPGAGGPGGFSGGHGNLPGIGPGAGQGPGGGRVGTAATSSLPREDLSGAGSYGAQASVSDGRNFHGDIYGSELLLPLIGGSGGAGQFNWGFSRVRGNGGGGGGGAILIASDTRIELITGLVSADGGDGGSSSHGSGGAIRLVAPQIGGSGTLSAEAGDGTDNGRIRIDAGVFGSQSPFSSSTPALRGVATFGINPVIFPENPPMLTLTNVAGRDISALSADSAVVNLPADGVAVQPVTVRAENFDSTVRFVVRVVPARGNGVAEFTGTIDNTTAGEPANATIDVTFPLDTSSQIFVWTEQFTTQP